MSIHISAGVINDGARILQFYYSALPSVQCRHCQQIQEDREHFLLLVSPVSLYPPSSPALPSRITTRRLSGNFRSAPLLSLPGIVCNFWAAAPRLAVSWQTDDSCHHGYRKMEDRLTFGVARGQTTPFPC